MFFIQEQVAEYKGGGGERSFSFLQKKKKKTTYEFTYILQNIVVNLM